MGVPYFYKWIVDKYPRIVVAAKEERPQRNGSSDENGLSPQVDTSAPNPNGLEFDNLYLDMNRIIHPCFHPDEVCPPSTFEEVFSRVFAYIDRLFCIVRPRKLLYLAIDGVAPRAKMNQQRTRRFMSAKNARDLEDEECRVRKLFAAKGQDLLPKQKTETHDSNVITPGTEFMFLLSKALEKYVCERLSCDPGWRQIKVILSDASVPGEGEHKIMTYIRQQRNQAGYDPSTRHCLCGSDADFIMLALSIHEIHFSILREATSIDGNVVAMTRLVLENRNATLENGGLRPQKPFQDTLAVENGNSTIEKRGFQPQKPFQILHVWILREYLELEFSELLALQQKFPALSFRFDLERIIDDFVFICFFAGNDFLPHLPSIEIYEKALDLLIHVYKKEFRSMGGYITDMSKINDRNASFLDLKRTEKFILAVGAFEEKIFHKRGELKKRLFQKIMRQGNMEEDDDMEMELQGSLGEVDGRNHANTRNLGKYVPAFRRQQRSDRLDTEVYENMKDLSETLKKRMKKRNDLFSIGNIPHDKIRLGEPGWKMRYYEHNFDAKKPNEVEWIRMDVATRYTEGLVWVIHYYYAGVSSWSWFYPYHYGPFASDLRGMSRTQICFELGQPFEPFKQLMAVLPKQSAHALPSAYRVLMLDPESPLASFYPSDFEVDFTGKRFHWQGIVKLPFIDANLLQQEAMKLDSNLSVEEKRRNAHHHDKIFVRKSNDVAIDITSLYQNPCQHIEIDPERSDGMKGSLFFGHYSYSPSGCAFKEAVFANYRNPIGGDFVPRPAIEVTFPEKTLIDEDEIKSAPLWHEYMGRDPPREVPAQRRVYDLPDDTQSSYRANFRGAGRGRGNGQARGNGDRGHKCAPGTSPRGNQLGRTSRW